jgi:hypothetical protein
MLHAVLQMYLKFVFNLEESLGGSQVVAQNDNVKFHFALISLIKERADLISAGFASQNNSICNYNTMKTVRLPLAPFLACEAVGNWDLQFQPRKRQENNPRHEINTKAYLSRICTFKIVLKNVAENLGQT